MDNATFITLLLWCVSVVIGSVGFTKTRRVPESALDYLLRISFGLCLAMSAWSVSAFALWWQGVPLRIGTVLDGNMAENWWLPFATVTWTFLTYMAMRRK